MFYDGPRDHVPVHDPNTITEEQNSSQRTRPPTGNAVDELCAIFPEVSRSRIEDAVRISHGDINAAADWITAQQSRPAEDTHESSYHSPSPIFVFRNGDTIPSSSPPTRSSRFACGSCGTIMSVALPHPPAPAGSQVSSTCPSCHTQNIIPLVDERSATFRPAPPPCPAVTRDTSTAHVSSSGTTYGHDSNSRTAVHSYSHNDEDVKAIHEIVPESSQAQIEEALRISHGDRDGAVDWILSHNEHSQLTSPSLSASYQPPMQVPCTISDVSSPVAVGQTRFKCGQCLQMITISLPPGPIQPGSQMSFVCPHCNARNIVPFRHSQSTDLARSRATLL